MHVTGGTECNIFHEYSIQRMNNTHVYDHQVVFQDLESSDAYIHYYYSCNEYKETKLVFILLSSLSLFCM